MEWLSTVVPSSSVDGTLDAHALADHAALLHHHTRPEAEPLPTRASGWMTTSPRIVYEPSTGVVERLLRLHEPIMISRCGPTAFR